MSETTIAQEGSAAADVSNSTDTYCQYLARQLCAMQGFAVGPVPEAAELAAACDIVLILNRVGAPFTILCLIDRESHPERTFSLSHQELERIGRDCAKYSQAAAPFGGPTSSIVIRVIEVGPTTDQRLGELRRLNSPRDAEYRTIALAIDTAQNQILREADLEDGFDRAFIAGLLRIQRQHAAELSPLAELPPAVFPYLTVGIIAALTLIFVGEVLFSIEASGKAFEPGIKTLISLGGLQQLLVAGQGQWWRLFTGPLLHGSPIHLAINCFVLLLAGSVLERIVGRLWLAAIFVISALAGACGSLLFNPHSLVSVGASGGIMGLFAAMLAVSTHYTNPQVRASLQKRAFGVLIPSMLPLASALHSGKVDFAAHIAGAGGGIVVGLLLVGLWREEETQPGLRWAAASVAALGLLGVALGGKGIADARNQEIAAANQIVLIPSEYLPQRDSDIHEASAWWYVAKYPSDPRSHLYKAIYLARKSDLAGAEGELRTALDQKRALEESLPSSVRLALQGTLAIILLDEHRAGEAREIASAACHDTSSDVDAKLNARGLCTNPG